VLGWPAEVEEPVEELPQAARETRATVAVVVASV
jgi:hypothetical protein